MNYNNTLSIDDIKNNLKDVNKKTILTKKIDAGKYYLFTFNEMVHLLDEFNSSDNEVDLNVDDDGFEIILSFDDGIEGNLNSDNNCKKELCINNNPKNNLSLSNLTHNSYIKDDKNLPFLKRIETKLLKKSFYFNLDGEGTLNYLELKSSDNKGSDFEIKNLEKCWLNELNQSFYYKIFMFLISEEDYLFIISNKKNTFDNKSDLKYFETLNDFEITFITPNMFAIEKHLFYTKTLPVSMIKTKTLENCFNKDESKKCFEEVLENLDNHIQNLENKKPYFEYDGKMSFYDNFLKLMEDTLGLTDFNNILVYVDSDLATVMREKNDKLEVYILEQLLSSKVSAISNKYIDYFYNLFLLEKNGLSLNAIDVDNTLIWKVLKESELTIDEAALVLKETAKNPINLIHSDFLNYDLNSIEVSFYFNLIYNDKFDYLKTEKVINSEKYIQIKKQIDKMLSINGCMLFNDDSVLNKNAKFNKNPAIKISYLFEQLMKDDLIDLSEFEDILNKDNLYLIINLMLNLQWSNCSDFKELNKIENMVVLKDVLMKLVED